MSCVQRDVEIVYNLSKGERNESVGEFGSDYQGTNCNDFPSDYWPVRWPERLLELLKGSEASLCRDGARCGRNRTG